MALFAANAAPTHEQMDSAPWSFLADRPHSETGIVKVYQAPIEGITCFKAISVSPDVDGPTLMDVVTDVPATTRWSSAGITRSELLAQSGNSYTYFQFLDLPGWTLSSDRIWFLTAIADNQSSTRSWKWTRMDSKGIFAERYQKYKSANPNTIEPPVNVGAWYFRDLPEGVEVTYMICTDAGGTMPYALQNAATRKTLPDTVGDLVREAKKRLGTP